MQILLLIFFILVFITLLIHNQIECNKIEGDMKEVDRLIHEHYKQED